MARLSAALACAAAVVAHAQYTVTVINQPDAPVVSYLDGNTPWPQSFNPAFVAASQGTGGKEGLLVRAQNCSHFTPGECISCNVNRDHPIAPWFPGSVLAFAQLQPDGTFAEPYLVFAPNASAPTDETYGTEDPRLAYDESTGLYHLFYTCYGKSAPYLCHATTTDPTAPYPGSWTRHGALFPNKPGSKSGALLIRDAPPHYLYWGAGTIALATSSDLLNFTTINSTFIQPRKDFFDNNLVESGPPPMRLADGNYIFFHNSANSTSGAYFDSYNAEWVIIDGNDPTRVLQRASVPLLSPTHGWETGKAPYECNVHNVTFLEAARPVFGQPGVFDVWFGGADAVIGTARVQVSGSAKKE